MKLDMDDIGETVGTGLIVVMVIGLSPVLLVTGIVFIPFWIIGHIARRYFKLQIPEMY